MQGKTHIYPIIKTILGFKNKRMQNTLSDFLLPENLETERLRFRKLDLSDVPAWNEFISDEAVKEFLKIDQTDPDASKKWILNQRRRYNDKLGGLLAIVEKKTNRLLGQAGILVQKINGENELEIGYHLLPNARKKGYATEAAYALIKHVFEKNLRNKIISLIHVDNTASQKVADNNGLKQLARTEYHNFPVFIYGISKADFETN